MATVGARRRPDFLLVGTQKGGTTSLYADLCQLPGVRAADMKEPQYLVGRRSDRSHRWYRSHFPVRGLTGDATPYLLFHPQGAPRAATVAPHARVIVMLRDPAARARSHWAHQVRAGREPLSFPEALDAEDGRIGADHAALVDGTLKESEAHQRYSYRRRGYYAEQLARWFQHYERDQVLVIESEAYFARPGEILAEVSEFLGVELGVVRTQARNVGSTANAAELSILEGLRVSFRDANQQLEQLLGRCFSWSSSQP